MILTYRPVALDAEAGWSIPSTAPPSPLTFKANVGQHNLLRLRHLVNTELNTKVQQRFAVTLRKYTQIQILCKYKRNYKSTGSI